MVIQAPTKLRIFSVTVLSVVLTTLFSFLGAPLLRALHLSMGSRFYWLTGLLISFILGVTGLISFAFLVPVIWITVGIYDELENKGRAGILSGALSVAVGTALAVLGPLWIFSSLGMDLKEALRSNLANLLKQMDSTQQATSWIAGVKVDADFLMSQIPSIIGIVVLSSLAFALMFDRKVAILSGLRFERVASHLRLLEFRLPDLMIWVTMFSFLLSFLKLGLPLVATVALNIFSFLVVAYFFQGLAVLESAFLKYRVGFFLRMAIYLFVVGQLFFLLSLVGLIDFWVDFRRRMRGNSAPGSNYNNGEHV